MSLKVNNLIGFGVGGVWDGTLAYSTHTATVAANTSPTVPSGIAAGDLLVAYAYSGGGNISVPSGWTSVADDAGTNFHIIAKISDGTETGSLELFTGTGEADSGMVIAFDGGAGSLDTIPDAFADISNGDIPAQVMNASTLGTLPFMVIGFYRSDSAISPRTFSGATEDGEQSLITGPYTYVKWKFYEDGSSPADITVDMGDAGSNHGMGSAIIEVR